MKSSMEKFIVEKTMIRNLGLFIFLLVLSFLLRYNSLLKSEKKIYDRNFFKVSINDIVLNTYYDDTVDKTYIPYIWFYDIKKSDWNSYNSENYILDTSLNSDISLSFLEYECYHSRYGYRIGCNYEESPEIKKVDNAVVKRFVLSKDGNNLYDGKLIHNLSSYIKEEGKYTFYFEIYNDENNVSTKLNGILLVRDQNEDI